MSTLSAAGSPEAKRPGAGQARVHAWRTAQPGAPDRRLAELVCSNSFRSDDHEKNAVGLLHHEMRGLRFAGHGGRGESAGARRVGAGGGPRRVFRRGRARLAALPNLTVVRERIDVLPQAGLTIVATGPLTAEALASSIGAATGADSLAFFDAIAPIVYRDTIDMDVAGWPAAGTRATRTTSTAR
jgi:methylenetetrahydrofolate--tRNA-(uracil-5-)-methyltransferase